jgi:AraC-like DNA-binding protein
MPSTMIHLAPAAPLARFVRDVRFVEASDLRRGAPYVRFPDGSVELAFIGGRTLAVGTRTSPLRKVSAGGEHTGAAVVRFAPAGAYPFFGGPLAALTDRIVPLDEVWGRAGRDLSDAVAEARGNAARLALIAAALTRRLTSERVFEPAAAIAVRRAIRSIAAAPVLPSVPVLASAVGLSPRQLRRVFADVVGVSPKQWLRIVRFQRALAAARGSPAPDWSAVARDTGYFDQAHLIGEFRAFAGVTPGALAATGSDRREPVVLPDLVLDPGLAVVGGSAASDDALERRRPQRTDADRPVRRRSAGSELRAFHRR